MYCKTAANSLVTQIVYTHAYYHDIFI